MIIIKGCKMMKIRNIKESMQVARGAGASMVAVVMLLMAFSCEKNVIPTPEEVRTPACISADNGSSDTKSALDGLTFTWAAGDKISLFHDNSGTAMNEQFSIVKTAGTFNPSESFDGTVTGWTSGDKFYGVIVQLPLRPTMIEIMSITSLFPRTRRRPTRQVS